MASVGKSVSISSHLSLLFHSSKRIPPLISFPFRFRATTSIRLLSAPFSSTPYPLQYDLIISRPSPRLPRPHSKPTTTTTTDSSDSDSPEPDSSSQSQLSFEDWVDMKLTQNETHRTTNSTSNSLGLEEGIDKNKRKYYNKRKKRMYGSDSDDERRKLREKAEFVELQPQVVELNTLHKREEELYFYDALAFPWEKDKHYKMVYQLEKKYFPDHSLDNAFLQPAQLNNKNKQIKVPKSQEEEDKGLIFFDDKEKEKEKEKEKDLSDKKVEEFFKCLKKVPNNKKDDDDEPFLASRTSGLPSKWDTSAGTVVLVNKPKGWTSFTVCGKLRRLTKIKKVGHAGTLDPMATGLLIVCVGKSTKVVDRYQGMIKGYSGIFRLGEATSTWDADSPVIQREPWEHIKDEDIRKAAASFTGEIWQVPPMFSAIKVGGEKMYDKARRGESIELSPRRISVFQFDIERSLEDRQNLIFRVTCSKGTYIRSLCADLGKALGSCAHLTALRRDSIGDYTAADAYEFQELEDKITKMYL